MANRCTLHVSKQEQFTKWLEQEGYAILPSTNQYEVIRAKKHGTPGIVSVYKKAKTLRGTTSVQHLTTYGEGERLMLAFLGKESYGK